MPDPARVGPALRIAAAGFALCLLSLPLAARAEGFVYWANPFGVPEVATIARANLDGSGVEQSFIAPIAFGGPGGIAVDARHVYWTNLRGTIGRANLDGTEVEQGFISGAQNPLGVDVDGAHVYWTSVGGTGTIGRANLDGTDVEQGFIGGAGAGAADVAVDRGHVYWARSGGIARANLDGTGVELSFITLDGCVPSAVGVAVDAGHVYWINEGYRCYGVGPLEGTIGRANRDGTGVEQSIAPAYSSGGIAVDANHIYWTNSAGYHGASVYIARANLDGSGVDVSFISGHGGKGIAVDGLTDTVPPRTRITKGAPNRTEESRVRFKFTSSEPGSSFECKLDKKAFRPCESPRKLRHLGAGKHKFKVVATDAAGNTDPTAAKDRFKVVA